MSGLARLDAKVTKAVKIPARTLVAVVVLVAIVVALPDMGMSGKVPLLVGIFGTLAFTYSWHPVGGILGELSLAHVIFWGAGSYTVVLGANAGWSIVSGLVVAALVGAALAGLVVGFTAAARLESLYILAFTLVFVFFATAIVGDVEKLGRGEGLPVTGNLPLTVEHVYTVLAIYGGLLILLNAYLLRSRRGLVWQAIRDDTDRVRSLGWSVLKERVIAYTLTGALCAIGGGLEVSVIGFASPAAALDLHIVVIGLLAVYVGGPGTIWGPLFGVALLEGLATIAQSESTSVNAAQYARLIEYLVALVVVTLLLKRERRSRARAISAAVRRGDAEESAAPATGYAAFLERIRPGRRQVELRGRSPRRERPRPSGALRVEHLQKSFGGLTVLRDVSFTVEPGEVVGLVGPNGAGKSTICNIIAGTMQPDGGTVYLGDQRMGHMPPHKRTRAGLGRTYQTPKAFPSLTLAENVAIAGSRIGTSEAAELLRSYGVATPSKRGDAATLVERRIVEIARLTPLEPGWVVLDEPLAGLDAEDQQRLLSLIDRLTAQGTGVLIVEHLIPVIAPRTNRIVVLDGGRLIADGPPEEVLQSQEVVDAYLGQPVTMKVGAA
jgi:branched-chain amino acid transport system permease protein